MSTVVLIHGLWMTPLSWQGWKERFESQGHAVLAPGWPGVDDRSVKEIRQDPSALEAREKAKNVVTELGDPQLTLSHARHIDFARAKTIGLRVQPLEQDDAIQNAFLTVHHACMLTLSATPAIKLIENQSGVAVIQSASVVPGQ